MSEVGMESKEIKETIASFAKRKPDAAQKLRREVIMAWVVGCISITLGISQN